MRTLHLPKRAYESCARGWKPNLRLSIVSALLVLSCMDSLAQGPGNSVVFIKCVGPDGKDISGSGVIVSERGKILTAKHVAPPGYDCKGVVGTAAEDPTRKLQRRRTSDQYDAILLEFIPRPNEKFETVQYLNMDSELLGQDILAYGFRSEGTGQLSVRKGSISTIFPDEKGNIETDDRLTAYGMSGSPVFLKSNGGLVGIIGGAEFAADGAPSYFAVLSSEVIADEFDLILYKPSVLPPSDGNDRPADWTRYNNSRFGYRIDIPPSFSAVDEADNGDGGVSQSPDGRSELRVWGSHILEDNFASEVSGRIEGDKADGWNVSYEKRTAKWASWSGSKDGRIVYQRAIPLCDDQAAAYFRLEYEQSQIAAFDTVVARMVRSLSTDGECP